MDDRLEGMFGKWIFVSEQGFRGDDWAGAHNDTRAFSSWEILITLGRLEGISYQRFLTIFRRSENDQSES